MNCLTACSSNPVCLLIRYNKSQCDLFKAIYCQYLTPTSGKLLFKRKNLDHFAANQTLINHWAFTNNSNDSIGHSNLYNGFGVSFTHDRYCNPDSALSLTNGYYQAPTGVYFSGGPFSITAWINMRTLSYTGKLIDFGLGTPNNNVIFGVFFMNFGTPWLQTTIDSVFNAKTSSSKFNINLNVWYHIAATFDGNLGFMYIDGELLASSPQLSPPNLNRTSNLIGWSNWGGDGKADGVFDEIKFFNACLSQKDIFNIIQM